jgi:hypothetical protein
LPIAVPSSIYHLLPSFPSLLIFLGITSKKNYSQISYIKNTLLAFTPFFQGLLVEGNQMYQSGSSQEAEIPSVILKENWM